MKIRTAVLLLSLGLSNVMASENASSASEEINKLTPSQIEEYRGKLLKQLGLSTAICMSAKNHVYGKKKKYKTPKELKEAMNNDLWDCLIKSTGRKTFDQLTKKERDRVVYETLKQREIIQNMYRIIKNWSDY